MSELRYGIKGLPPDLSEQPTLRDWFAMAALLGRFAGGCIPMEEHLNEAAAKMYQMADAMLKARGTA